MYCRIWTGQGKERKAGMEINHVTESFARAYTEPFPPKVLVARAKKKVTDTTIGGTKKVHFLVQTGASSSRLHAHTLQTSRASFPSFRLAQNNPPQRRLYFHSPKCCTDA